MGKRDTEDLILESDAGRILDEGEPGQESLGHEEDEDILITDEAVPEQEEEEETGSGKAQLEKRPEEIDSIVEKRIEELLAKKQVDALSKSLQELTQSLKPKEPEKEPAKVISARLTPEERKKINEELFSSDNPAELIDSIIAAKVDSLVGVLAGETSKKFVEQERELLKLSNKDFVEFEKEIEELVQSLPAQQRYSPGVYRWALEQVKAKNIDRIVEKRLEEKLKELSAQQSQAQAKPIPPKQAPSSPTQGQPAPEKRRVVIPQWEVDRAIAKGIGPGSSFWEDTKKILIAKYSKKKA